jgi:hypothetical protein
MKYYGTLKWSTADAPVPVSGIAENFTYREIEQVFEHMGEEEIAAVVTHGKKGEITFSSSPGGDVTALLVRAGSELTIDGISGGKVLCTQASARWQRGSALTMEAQATHYPDLEASSAGSITPATLTLSRTAGPLQLPTDTIWYGVEGLTGPVAGIVQSASISESVQVSEEEDGAGEIVAVALYGYKATGSMEILTAAAKPAVGTELDLFGGFRITSSEERWSKGQTRAVAVEGFLIPGVNES